MRIITLLALTCLTGCSTAVDAITDTDANYAATAIRAADDRVLQATVQAPSLATTGALSRMAPGPDRCAIAELERLQLADCVTLTKGDVTAAVTAGIAAAQQFGPVAPIAPAKSVAPVSLLTIPTVSAQSPLAPVAIPASPTVAALVAQPILNGAPFGSSSLQ